MSAIDKVDLPAKEAQLFKQLVKYYESKQYKKGIRAADQVLKKHPKHGQTLSMKGLILCYQGKKAEAYELVREGLKCDLKSHVCWHVYGLLWRNDNNYEEAMKCYKNALRFEKDNLQILRDLSNLQIQTRDYAGFVQTRESILHLKPSGRAHWISLAIAHHLNLDYATAVKILESFADIQTEVPHGEEYEHSEMLMYQAMILEEAGKFDQSLEFLNSHQDELRDPLGLQETKARLYLRIGRRNRAEDAYRELIDVNPENHLYYAGLMQALDLPQPKAAVPDSATREKLLAVYKQIADKHPRSTSARRLPLEFLEGDEFRQHLELYIQRPLIKGIPSLFSDLKGLYRSETKAQIVGDVFEKVQSDLEKGMAFQDPPLADSKLVAPGEAALWTRIFLASHYDRVRQTEKALELVDQCIQDHPDELECQGVKRRILKHAGDLEGAVEAAFAAQALDSSDRYVNGVAAKTIFRADHITEADEMATVFTKASEQPNMLHDMQCMWYELEAGSAYHRQKIYGMALKNFLAVVQHFAAFEEDQFDFHQYCTRKMTLRSYISLLRMEDDIYKEARYAQAAQAAVRVYLDLADAPGKQKQQEEDDEALLASLSLEERKKFKLKRKQEAQKKAKEEQRRADEAKAKQDAGQKKGKMEKSKDKDEDPDGSQLAAVAEPLEEASKLLQVLRQNHDDKLETHLLSFAVAIQKDKMLLALQAVSKATRLVGKSHPEVHDMLVRLALKLQPADAPSKANIVPQEANGVADVREGIKKTKLEELLGGKSIQQLHDEFISQSASTSVLHSYTAAKLSVILKPECKPQALDSFIERLKKSPSLDLAQCQRIHGLLGTELRSQSTADDFFTECQSQFPYSTYFKGSKASPIFQYASK